MGTSKENRSSCLWWHLHGFCRLFIFMSSGPEGRRTATETHERWAGDSSSKTKKIKNGQGFLNSFLVEQGFPFFPYFKKFKNVQPFKFSPEFSIGICEYNTQGSFFIVGRVYLYCFNRINVQKIGRITNYILWHFSSRGACEKNVSAYKVYLKVTG